MIKHSRDCHQTRTRPQCDLE